jgi:hypothetical protein
MLTFSRICPRCSSWEVFKSRFRTVDFILSMLLLRPVRCGDCYQRHYRPLFFPALDRYQTGESAVRPNASA